jgi:hypothetical protein
VRLDTATVDEFAPLVGDRFTAHPGEDEADVELELTAAVPALSPGPEGARHPFTLTFVGPPGAVLPQRIYRLDHPGLGGLDIFLVPIGRDEAGTTYEAVFS